MQLVSFKLGDETYGIEITKIREIILVGEITHVPETPPYVKGPDQSSQHGHSGDRPAGPVLAGRRAS